MTENRKKADGLRATLASFAAIIDQSPIGIYVVDAALRVRHVNPRARLVFSEIAQPDGRELSELLAVVCPDSGVNHIVASFARVIRTGEPHVEKYFAAERSDRPTQAHYDWEVHRMILPDGEAVAVCYFMDVSGHVLTQRALHENAQQIRATFNQAAVGMATANLEGRFERVNQRFCEMLGYTAEELYSRTFVDLTYPPDRDPTNEQVQRLVKGETTHYALEKRFVRKDGAVLWILTTVTLMKDEAGHPDGFIGVVEDITQRKRAEDASRESALRLQLALDAGQLADWTWDASSDGLTYGPRFSEIFGIPTDTSFTWRELAQSIHVDDRERVVQAVQRSLAEKTDYNVEYRILLRSSGKLRWIAAKGRGMYTDRGEPTGMSGVVQDITDLKAASEALQDRERELSLIYHNVSDVIFYLSAEEDGGFRFVSVNQAFLTTTGLPEASVVGQRVEQVIPEPSCSIVLGHYRRAIAEKKTQRWEETSRYPSGEKSGAVSITPIFDARGACINLIGTVHDVTERRYSEEARLRLAAVVESSDDAILSMTLEGIVTTWNQGAERMYGYCAAEIIGRSVTILLPADRIDEEPAILERLKRGERVDHYETERQRKDGTRLDVALTVSPIKDASGRIIGASKISRDVTKRRLTEQALRASEQRFRDLADAMPQIVWTAQPDGEVDYFNQRWFDYTGFQTSDGGVEHWEPAIHGDDLPNVLQLWKRAVASGAAYEAEYRLKDQHGQYRWHLARALSQSDVTGAVIRWYGSCTDIHEQKLTAGALREEYVVTEHLNQVAQALASHLDVAKIVQIITDAGTRIIRAQFGAFFYNVVNEQGESYTLYTLSGIPREAFEKFPMPRATSLFGPTFRGEGVVRIDDVRKDERYGKNPPYHGMPAEHPPVTSFLSVPVFARSGEVLGGLFFGHAQPGAFTQRDEIIITGIAAQAAAAMDTARLYQAEQQARAAAEQANKAKDHFLATLSHELRTPLTPVLAILSGLGEDAAVPEALANDLATVRRNVQLEARLIDDLLDLTRVTRGKLELHGEQVQIGTLIDNAIATCQGEAEAKQLKLIRDLDRPEQLIRVDGARVTQILWNLLRNSVKFTPEGGTITVRLRVSTLANGEGKLMIEIQDTGIGMEPPQMEKMFDAFEQGSRSITQQFGGLGLGLAISKALVEAHHGTISGTSEGAGRGSIFIVTLPLEACVESVQDIPIPTATPFPPAGPNSTPTARPTRILLVEDHADTAAVMTRMLQKTGYEILHAGTIQDALTLAAQEAAGAGFNLVVSDLSLPDGSGLDLMRELTSKYRIPGIAMSGFGMDADRAESAAAGFSRHLTKPVDINVLRATIREMLLQSAAGA